MPAFAGRTTRLSDSRAAAGRHHTPPSLSLAASPERYDDGKQRWLYAASEPNLTTIGMHSLSPGLFPCNTLARAANAAQSEAACAAAWRANLPLPDRERHRP